MTLGGVKSITLLDDHPTELIDLSSQFYLQPADLGKPRAHATRDRLAELNTYVPVSVIEGALTEERIKHFQVVVLTNVSLEEQLRVNAITHQHGICFISTQTNGLFGSAFFFFFSILFISHIFSLQFLFSSIFCDFGDDFEVSDVNGENPVTALVASVTQEAEGVVTTLDESRHGLEDGDFVTFAEVGGMAELNGCAGRKVKVLGPYTFSIGDTTALTHYKTGGIVIQVKQPKRLKFVSGFPFFFSITSFCVIFISFSYLATRKP